MSICTLQQFLVSVIVLCVHTGREEIPFLKRSDGDKIHIPPLVELKLVEVKVK